MAKNKKGKRTKSVRGRRENRNRRKVWYRNPAVVGAVVGGVVVVAILLLLVFRSRSNEVTLGETPFTYREIGGGYTEEGFPYLGQPDAPVTLMEFTDFDCSHCRDYKLESEEAILEEYVATGQVRYVLHYYSMPAPHSMQAAEAAICAGEQGQYFPYQHALFENPARTRADFIARAEALGLDTEAFATCWDTSRYHNLLVESTRSARAMGVSATPTFDVNGRLVVGNRPDVLRQAIEEALGQAD